MRKSLLRAFLVLLVFYYFLGFGYWFFSNDLIESSARSIGINEEVTAYNALYVAVQVLKHQIKEYSLIVPSLFAGSILVILFIVLYFRFRAPPEHQNVDGIYYSLGEVPTPAWQLKAEKARLEFEDEALSKKFNELPEVYQNLIYEIAYLLSKHQDAYIGDGHGNTLLEHSLEVFEKALLDEKNDDPLLPVIALSHDLGKILSHEKIDGKWVRKAYHDKLSGLILSGLPSFKQLPFEEQSLLLLAVKYSHSKAEMPIFPSNKEQDRLQKLFFEAVSIDKEQTKEEKKEVKKKLSLEELFEKDFHRIISQIQFQQYGLAKGEKAGGWRNGDSIFVLEVHVRQAIVSLADADLVAAEGGMHRAKGSIPNLTKKFMEYCKKKGWLIDEYKGMAARNGLWTIKPGKIVFKGVFWLKLPESMHFLLPENAPYEVEVLEPTHGDLNQKQKKTSSRKPKVKLDLKKAIENERKQNSENTMKADQQSASVEESVNLAKKDESENLSEDEKKKLRAVSAALGIPL